MSKRLLLAPVLATLAPLSLGQSIIRVDASAPSGGDGSSWGAAYASLDQALGSAVEGDELWVAAGTYKPRIPTSPLDRRTISFTPANGVLLFGGFDGTETHFDQRAGLFHETVLDGDIGAPGWFGDNAYHVLRLEGNGAYHVVDGFRIQNGNANQATGIHSRGGALYAMLGTKILRNLTFARNRATRGAAIDANGGLLFLTFCTFESNTAEVGGGAIRASFDIWAASCTFRHNVAGGGGGAVYLSQNMTFTSGLPRPTFQSCLFYGNQALNGGAVFAGSGGVTNSPGKVNLSGCTLTRNRATNAGGAIWSPPSLTPLCDVRVRNSIVYWNSAPTAPSISGAAEHYEVLWSDVQGGWPGLGNIDLDPRFADPLLGDFSLASASPCIDAGDSLLIAPDHTDADGDLLVGEEAPYDLVGGMRRIDDPLVPDTGPGPAPVPDMGCLERAP